MKFLSLNCSDFYKLCRHRKIHSTIWNHRILKIGASQKKKLKRDYKQCPLIVRICKASGGHIPVLLKDTLNIYSIHIGSKRSWWTIPCYFMWLPTATLFYWGGGGLHFCPQLFLRGTIHNTIFHKIQSPLSPHYVHTIPPKRKFSVPYHQICWNSKFQGSYSEIQYCIICMWQIYLQGTDTSPALFLHLSLLYFSKMHHVRKSNLLIFAHTSFTWLLLPKEICSLHASYLMDTGKIPKYTPFT